MTDDDMDGVFRAARVPVDLSADRIERVMDEVIARLERMPAQAWWRGWLLAWREWIVSGTPTTSMPRFAAVLAVAALLGTAVGHTAEDADSPTHITDLFSATTLFQDES